ncbi:hypothetical protein [Pusillimonas sp. ANT_WB101]|uniref:hypothetical protein n=1 Tax=Pusillimonas sp. ANT_WB101 TaxID=2597356 RepID=UPI0011EF5BE6|nr:hypothetical protein [Pusillimonas sp. ANT_WB101]KAA0911684.1 hypothetical protein FQ179_07745 [Pusillimonas sp. ANT_WB101]
MCRFLLILAEIKVVLVLRRLQAAWLFCAYAFRYPASCVLLRLVSPLRVICLTSGYALLPFGSAHADVASRLNNMQVPGLVWQPVQPIDVAAIPLHIKPFTATQSVARVAEALADHQDVFQRILVSPGLAILSGVSEEAHWLAEIWRVSEHPESSAGRVSVLSFAGLPNLPVADHHAYAWLPTHATKLAQWGDDTVGPPTQAAEPARGVIQTLYRMPASAAILRHQLASRLRSQGWSALLPMSSELSVPSWQLWQQHGEELFLFFLDTAQGFFLYVHHTR